LQYLFLVMIALLRTVVPNACVNDHMSCTYWCTVLNTALLGWQQLGNQYLSSSTATHAFLSQNPYIEQYLHALHLWTTHPMSSHYMDTSSRERPDTQ
jgi:hypothetical protein